MSNGDTLNVILSVLTIILTIITIYAIYIGPIKAVMVTREIDHLRESRMRKMNIFRDLMKTRRNYLNIERVNALNLISVEFFGIESVIKPYKLYLDALQGPVPEQMTQLNIDKAETLFLDLLQAIGDELGYKFDKNELRVLGYIPVGWEKNNNILQHNYSLISELLEGKRSLPISKVRSNDRSL